MIRTWRLIKAKHADAAFSGEGTRRWGGRWNSKGHRVVYTSENLSLAVLEVMVHAPSYDMLKNYVYIPVEFDSGLVETVDERDLPAGWQADPAPSAVKALGDRWIEAQDSAVLKIPSVVIPVEFNYLINPTHPDFEKLMIYPPERFVFDFRLIKK